MLQLSKTNWFDRWPGQLVDGGPLTAIRARSTGPHRVPGQLVRDEFPINWSTTGAGRPFWGTSRIQSGQLVHGRHTVVNWSTCGPRARSPEKPTGQLVHNRISS